MKKSPCLSKSTIVPKSPTLGLLLNPRLSEWGSLYRFASRAGISTSYLCKMRGDKVKSVSETVQRRLAAALQVDRFTVAQAVIGTARKFTRSLKNQRDLL